jgi:hypothetical protein
MKHLFAICALFLFFTACETEDPEIINEEEVITTLIYTLTDANGNAKVLKFVDIDGDGAGAAVITADTLDANTAYTGSIQLLNESETPAEDITAELESEKDDHLFFFNTTAAGITIATTDVDSNNEAVGLKSTLTTTTAGNNTIEITLKHEPTNKIANDLANVGGSTDIEVKFNVVIK